MRNDRAAGLTGVMAIVLLLAGCAGTPTVPAPAEAEPRSVSGDGQFVHAPSSGDTVRIALIDSPYYQRHLVAVGRLLP